MAWSMCVHWWLPARWSLRAASTLWPRGKGLPALLDAGPARWTESGGILELFKIRERLGVAMQRIVWLIQIVVVAGLVLGGFYYSVRRQPDPVKRAVLLRRAGFGLMALSTFFFGAFVIGDTFTDPGGWKAAGLVAAWVVPLAGLAALSWLRPGWAVYALAVLSAAVIGVSIWSAISPEAWRSFEDRHGPILAVLIFVLVAAIAVLGLKRTSVAGVLLLAVGVIPAIVSSLGSSLGFASLSVVSAPPVIAGVLYLVSAHMAERPPPPAHTGTASVEQPKAA
jgi:hypothetical protein